MCLTIDFSSAAPAIIAQLFFTGIVIAALVIGDRERKREWESAKEFFNNLANPDKNRIEPFDK